MEKIPGENYRCCKYGTGKASATRFIATRLDQFFLEKSLQHAAKNRERNNCTENFVQIVTNIWRLVFQ
jgi:hypothetical protein